MFVLNTMTSHLIVFLYTGGGCDRFRDRRRGLAPERYGRQRMVQREGVETFPSHGVAGTGRCPGFTSLLFPEHKEFNHSMLKHGAETFPAHGVAGHMKIDRGSIALLILS
jgi:hypothetical protein